MNKATGMDWRGESDSVPGLRFLSLHHGYMEPVVLTQILVEVGTEHKTIFYGQDEIVTRSICLADIFYN